MAGSGAALLRANAALATAGTSAALAGAAQAIANQPKTSVLFAAAYGVVADGVTDDTNALQAAINAANTTGSSYSAAWFREVVLPAGRIRITRPITCNNGLTSQQFRLRGAGRNSTEIYADFYTTAAAPSFTVSGGGGSGAVLFPVFYFDGVGAYKLARVFVIAGGSGYASAPTATLVATTGSGANVTCTVAGGKVTSVAVNSGGTGYPANCAGDALVVVGSNTEISDISVTASASRAAASNGGIAVYPYFTTNNGIRYELLDNGTLQTGYQNILERVNVSGHPGHGVECGRPENWRVFNVSSSNNGADGFFAHTNGNFTSGAGISNTFVQCRAASNLCRGMNINGLAQSSWMECCIYNNLQGGGAVGYVTLVGGAIQSVATANAGAGIAAGTTPTIVGGGGSGATIVPTIVGGKVTGWAVSNGGSGYSSNPSGATAASIPTVYVASVTGLPGGVNEEIVFNLCNGVNWHGDAEMSTGSAVGRDVIRVAGSYPSKISGYVRGGRYGIYLNTGRMATIDELSLYGISADYTNSIVFCDTGQSDYNYVPIILGIYNLGSANIQVQTSGPFLNGWNSSIFNYIAMRGGQFATSQVSAFAPNPNQFGTDEYITLTGNVAIANPVAGSNGVFLNLVLLQDATGGRAPTFGTQYVGISSIGSGTANQICILLFRCVTLNATRGTLWILEKSSGWL